MADKKGARVEATPEKDEKDAKPRTAAKAKMQRAGTLKFHHVFTAQNAGLITDDYKIEKKVLGEGSYGQVSKGEHKVTKAIRAIKSIDISKIADNARWEKEVKIQQSLDHPNIVKLYEVYEDAKRMYLVMELCNGGELFDRIVEEAEKHADNGTEGQAFNERGAANYMTQIMGAMQYLHNLSFVHRDIKPENFLLQNKSHDSPLKVIDFGLAKDFEPGVPMKTKAGTPYYVAPQVLAGSYSEKCDIWSCGVIAYILLCGYPPFYGDKDEDILRSVKSGKFEFPSPDWDEISIQGKELIKKMLTLNEKDRPTAKKVLEHEWLDINADKPTGTLQKDLGTNLRKFHGVSKLKKVALTLIAQQLNEKDIEELKNTFHLLDKNRDGTLSMPEIEAGMKQHNVEMPKDFEKTLKAMDTDGSGTVDYTEFIAATLTTQQYMKTDVLWAAFRTFDKDGDGYITKAEIKQILVEKDSDLSDSYSKEIESQVKMMMDDNDKDGDGQISFSEFKAMMCSGKDLP